MVGGQASVISSPLIIVTGMMRSGTSAVAGSLARLGFTVGEDADTHNEMNPTGYFESASIARVNELAYELAQAAWYCPPRAGELDASPGARRLFATRGVPAIAVLGSGPALWKDPKASPLLALWRSVVERPVGAVFVWRDPGEVAVSLWRSNRLPLRHGLALWAAYNHAALAGMEAMPVFGCRYESLLTRPPTLIEGIGDLLGHLGGSWRPSPTQVGTAESFFSAGLHRDLPLAAGHPLSAEVASLAPLAAALGDIEGFHRSFAAMGTAVPIWAEELLDAQRASRAEIAAARTALHPDL